MRKEKGQVTRSTFSLFLVVDDSTAQGRHMSHVTRHDGIGAVTAVLLSQPGAPRLRQAPREEEGMSGWGAGGVSVDLIFINTL